MMLRQARSGGSYRAAAVAVAVALAAATLAATKWLPASAALAPPLAASAAPQPDEASALVAAARAGRRVEVAGLRAPARQVFANPDGTLTAELTVVPQRVERADGSWVPVDTTLRRRPDGTVTPAATPMPMALSGGGDGPLARLGPAGRQLILEWPGPLPEPSLSGDTATYREVLPGVDLRLRATPKGLDQRLVVKTRQAASNPELAALRVRLRGDGLEVKADQAGNLRAVDGSGTTVVAAPRPLPRDATGRPLRTRAAAAKGAAEVPTRLDGGGLALMTADMVAPAPGVVFPMAIGRGYTDVRDAWTKVAANFPNQSYWNGANDADDPRGNVKVGHESEDGTTWRSFFQFNTRPVAGKQILRAVFSAFEGWSWSCSPRHADLHLTGAIGPSTRWALQPHFFYEVSTVNVAKGRPGCPAGRVEWDATRAVRDTAAGHKATTTLALTADDEADTFAWKRFRDSDVRLSITYNSIPNVPTALSTVPTTRCTTGAGRPFIFTPRPVLRARATDPDGGAVKALFEWWHTGGARVGGTFSVVAVSGTTFAARVPAGAFHDGDHISWRVRADDGIAHSGWSRWCEATVDSTPPQAAPGVSSASYPDDNSFHDGVGKPGTFTFTANGVTDAARYIYSVSGGPARSVAATGLGGPATVTITPVADGPNTLKVFIQDRAGNTDPHLFTEHKFLVSRAAGPVGYWKLDEGAGATVADSSGHGHPLTFGGPATWGGDRWELAAGTTGASGAFDGTAGSAVTSEPVVHTDRSFSVSAWVRLTSKGDYRTAVSQDGARGAGFYLQYAPGLDRWRFSMISADADSFATHAAVSAEPAALGRWTHLTGVYDSGAGRVQLYVDGRLAGETAWSGAWDAAGPLRIGAAKGRGTVQNHWVGEIDEVRVYDRMLLPTPGPSDARDSEIQDLVNQPAVATAWWPLDGVTGAEDEPPGDGTPAPTTTSGGGPPVPVPTTTPPQLASTDDSLPIPDPIGDPIVPIATPDALGRYPAKVFGGWAVVPGHVGNALHLGGNGEAVAPAVVDTTHSYTVTLWARLGRLDRQAAAVSQGGTRSSAFMLQYIPSRDPAHPDAGRWQMAIPAADVDGGTVAFANSLGPPRAGEGAWTHLAGVYDRGRQEVRLYVDGVLQSRAPVRGTWHAGGGLRLGSALWRGTTTNLWPGDLDEVRVHQGVLTDRQIQQLASL